MKPAPSIFAGIKVLDLTKVYSGPLATRYLADYGAIVTKIENPHDPDPARSFPPLKNGSSGYFEILNRNKGSLGLDLKDQRQLQDFYELVKDADIVVENMSPSAKHNLKIDYETLEKLNPKLIYASLCGKDQESNDKYFDVIAQAESGLISLSGTPKNPAKIGPAVVDAFAGVNLAFAISSALYYREHAGLGQHLNVSMLASAMNMLEQNLINYSVTGVDPIRPGNVDNAIAPFGVYRTFDSYVVLAIGSDNIWQSFVSAFAKYPELAGKDFDSNQVRLANQGELTRLIENIFAKSPTSAILHILKDYNIPSTKIAEMSDVAQNNWFYEHGALQKINHPNLGECIVPGRCIDFSTQDSYGELKLAPTLPTSQYTFTPITEGDTAQLTKLLDLCFDIKNKNKTKLIEWKYFDKVYESSTCAYGAFIGDKLVSFYSNKQVEIKDAHLTYRSGLCLDMTTHPGHRGKKLISKLSKLTYADRESDNYDFSLGFSNESGVKVDQNSSGYGYSIVGQFMRYITFAVPTMTDLVVSTGTILHSWPSLSFLHFAQSEDYLSWRYKRKPNNEYQVLDIIDKKGELFAQAIVIATKTKLEIFKLLLNNVEDTSLVLRALRNYGFDQKKKILVIRVLANSFWTKALRANQFVKFNFRENPYYLTVKTLAHAQDKQKYLTNPESWFLMGGDVL